MCKNTIFMYNKTLADSLQLDHDACGNLDSMIVPCCGELRELKSGHYHKVVEITENAGKCLLDEYTVSIFKRHRYDLAEYPYCCSVLLAKHVHSKNNARGQFLLMFLLEMKMRKATLN